MTHQSTDHCVWNCLESVKGAPYELSSNTNIHTISVASTYKHSLVLHVHINNDW